MNRLVVVVDMQNDFINGSLGSEDAQKIVPKAVTAIEHYSRDPDSQIQVTLDWHDEDYPSTLEGKLLTTYHCMVGTEGYSLNEDIAKAIKKNYEDWKIWYATKSTFGYNWFKEFSQDSFAEIVIFGLCTDICVVSNALILRAAYPNTPIKCLAYCCAGTNMYAHECALQVMESCQIEIIREEGEY